MELNFLSGMGGGQVRLFRTFLFLVRLLVLATPLYLILFFADLRLLQYVVASNAFLVLNLMGFEMAQEGALLTAGNFVFLISPDSTGWKSIMFLFALIFAVPGVALRKRTVGMLAGLPLIWTGNIGRIIAIVFVESVYGIESAILAHDFLWRFGLIGIVLMIWIFWLRWSKA